MVLRHYAKNMIGVMKDSDFFALYLKAHYANQLMEVIIPQEEVQQHYLP